MGLIPCLEHAQLYFCPFFVFDSCNIAQNFDLDNLDHK